MPCKQGRPPRKPEIPDTYRSHIEVARKQVSIYDGPVVLAEGLAKFPSYVGDLLAVHWFLLEHQNGGLEQFFLNPTGILAPEVIKGFTNMGLQTAADSLEKCCRIFGDSYPRNLEDREVILLRLCKATDPREVMAAEPFKKEGDVIEAISRQILLRMNECATDQKG